VNLVISKTIKAFASAAPPAATTAIPSISALSAKTTLTVSLGLTLIIASRAVLMAFTDSLNSRLQIHFWPNSTYPKTLPLKPQFLLIT
jgi:hypothetical protein